MAIATVIPDVASLKSFVGKELGPSEWETITQRRIDAFAEATGDHQWIHVDVERAERESPFGATIAHGYLVLALAPKLLAQVVRVDGVAFGVNHGIDRMRFRAPVPCGSRLRLSARIKDVRDVSGGAARVTFTLSFEVEGQARLPCSAEAIYVYMPERV